MPATFAKMSSVPTVCAVCAQAVSFATSNEINFPPMRSAAAFPFASLRSAIQTVAPACANVSAIAAPMPDAAPVMKAVLFLRLNTVNPFRVGLEQFDLTGGWREREKFLHGFKPA